MDHIYHEYTLRMTVQERGSPAEKTGYFTSQATISGFNSLVTNPSPVTPHNKVKGQGLQQLIFPKHHTRGDQTILATPSVPSSS